jgi:hypothetical protein
VLPLVLWLGSLVVGLVVFLGLGSGALAPPTLTDPASWGDWAASRDPLVATVAVLRLIVLALAWYLVGVTTIGIVARLARAARLVRVADALTVPVVRRLLQGALGLGLATAMVGAATPAVHRPPTPTVTADAIAEDEVRVARATGDEVRLARATGDEVRLARAEAAPPQDVPPVPLRLLDAGAGAAPAATDDDGIRLQRVEEPDDEDAPDPSEADDTETVGEDPVATADDRYEVVGGDSLWRIAAATLAAERDRAPTDEEVDPYWRALIERNRHHLADPDNPDLIFPGQVLELPPTDTGGRP